MIRRRDLLIGAAASVVAGEAEALTPGQRLLLSGGGKYTSGQSATLAKLKSAALAAQIANPDTLAVYSTTTPTITLTGAADGTLSNEYLFTTQSALMRCTGGVPVQSLGTLININNWGFEGSNDSSANGNLNGFGLNTSANTWSCWSAAVEFETDATTFEVRCNSNAGIVPFRCIVDGQYLDKTGIGLSGTNTWYHVAGLPANGADGSTFKKIKVEHRHIFYSVRVAPGKTIRYPSSAVPKGVLEGDSYTEGQTIRYSGAINVNGHISWGMNTVRNLGWGTARQTAVGLTGYVNIGTNRRIISDRVADWSAYETLDYIIVAGGFNDGTNYSSITTNSTLTFQLMRAAQPNALIVVMGVWPNGNVATKGPDEDAVLAGYQAWGDKFSIYIPVCRDPAGAWTYAGDIDGTHPSNQGHLDIAALAIPAIRTKLLAM